MRGGPTRIRTRIHEGKIVHVIERRVRLRWRAVDGMRFNNKFTAIAAKSAMDRMERVTC